MSGARTLIGTRASLSLVSRD